jgi:hypothetical protein
MNNQPWRFAVIKDAETKAWLADLTQYGSTLKSAGALIAVFMDNASSYDRTKDLQAIGACIQNMLLAIHSIGLGGLWLGEILKNRILLKSCLAPRMIMSLWPLLPWGTLRVPEASQAQAAFGYGISLQITYLEHDDIPGFILEMTFGPPV